MNTEENIVGNEGMKKIKVSLLQTKLPRKYNLYLFVGESVDNIYVISWHTTSLSSSLISSSSSFYFAENNT